MPIKNYDTYQGEENKRWFQKWWPKDVPKNITLPEITVNDMLEKNRENLYNLVISHKFEHISIIFFFFLNIVFPLINSLYNIFKRL